MKLELKHLAPYLPYGLKVMNNNGDFHVMTGYALDAHFIKKYTVAPKPILRPLSDLTKEIQIAEFFCSYYDHLEMINPSSHETQNCAIMLDGTIEMQYYNDYQQLFKWHFDVFGLIEKGLAIDINTLKQD